MEIKKSPKADLENKRGYFTQIGLIVALAAVIGMFSWSQGERKIEVVQESAPAVETEVVEVTIQEDKRPPAPFKTQAVAISEMLNIVRNDAKIEQTITLLDLDVDQLAADVTKVGGTYTGTETVLDDEPVIVAEEMPTFQGGDVNKFSAWCQKRVKYPQQAIDNGSEGKVVTMFVVEKDGTIKDVQILSNTDPLLNAEAKRVILSSPKWNPGRNRGKAVRVRVTMPLTFKLE